MRRSRNAEVTKFPDTAGPVRHLSTLLARVAILTAAILTVGLALTTIPASADATSDPYTIGSPTAGVTDVAAAPSSVSVDTSTQFTVTFTLPTALSGGGADWVSVVPSTPLGSTPSAIALSGSSCVQSGTNGGAYSATGFTVDLSASCSLGSGTQGAIYFTADAPAATGTFSFSVTTSQNSTPGTSNEITVATAGPILTAAAYDFGANTTYTISNAIVANLSTSATTLSLTAEATSGTGTITFVNSGSGGAGYSVSVTPSGGSASLDAVTNASASGADVTLTLGTALVDGDALTITATGTNPAASASSEADHVKVQPGDGTTVSTNSIAFGDSVTAADVSPSTLVAGAAATYTIGFKASDAAADTGDIYLTEELGPTNFSTVTGSLVSDTTQGWHFVASGSVYSSGSATLPLQDAISAGDSISITMVNVTNPASPGTISDFTVATSGDPVAADATPYTIGANASPGVVVSVDPTTAGAVASYTISNLFASAALVGGTSTIQLKAPAGTVFANNPSTYQVTDLTTATGSGMVTAFSGGATNVVTLYVPNDINSGDALSLNIEDVVNPSTASSTDVITLIGSVTGPAPEATTTTTTTTVPTVKKPAVRELTSRAKVVSHGIGTRVVHVVGIRVRCTVEACRGTISLADNHRVVGAVKYSEGVGKTDTFSVDLTAGGARDLATVKDHTIRVTATVTVGGGTTVKEATTLVG
jgi:hypothetical protein